MRQTQSKPLREPGKLAKLTRGNPAKWEVPGRTRYPKSISAPWRCSMTQHIVLEALVQFAGLPMLPAVS